MLADNDVTQGKSKGIDKTQRRSTVITVKKGILKIYCGSFYDSPILFHSVNRDTTKWSSLRGYDGLQRKPIIGCTHRGVGDSQRQEPGKPVLVQRITQLLISGSSESDAVVSHAGE